MKTCQSTPILRAGRSIDGIYRPALTSKCKLHPGAYVAINGPWDTYGTVTSSRRQGDGLFLNQIRGIKKRDGERPICSF